ncbi:Dna transposase THAP9-like protein [Plakobranchus ocellatus]|uniref:Dna transposase THAP9-like protein n=1 Tax=Plakobranchus ocellatus TaxID=259542 RepID=A0AAV3YSH0_9GAST|nr:Dna transposase THAP9-like protein [Plakobranchus ocellatus]
MVCSQEVKKFAITLNFLSASAYEYVSNTLVYLMRRSKSSVDCHLGFLEQSLVCAGRLADQTSEWICSLIVDEMSLRTDLVWKDASTIIQGKWIVVVEPVENFVAPNALVVMVVSFSGGCKAPII